MSAAPQELQRGLEVLAKTQHPSGSWKGDYSGPLFLIPVYVVGLYAMNRLPEQSIRDGFIAHLRAHQNADGGWGLDVESHSHVFTSVLNYVCLRLLDVGPEDPALVRARNWFLPKGGPLGSASWGKFLLSLLGLYEYAGLNPVQPELWLLPKTLPIHPSRLWCHCRMVYLPMSWLYGRRFRVPETPLLKAIREEIYAEPYAQVNWKGARGRVAQTDAYTPHSPLMRAVNRVLAAYERVHARGLRERALDEVLEQIRGEDQATSYICIGPINKVLNSLVWHVAKPGGAEEQTHLKRLPDYLYHIGNEVKVNGYNSSELWDTAFAVQAIAVTGRMDQALPMLTQAAQFIEANQVIEDSPNTERYYRHPSRGAWPFSTRDHGWPISDCTAEGLKASLVLDSLGLNRISRERLAQSVEFMLSLQNRDGGWATYEPQRGPLWLERLNPSDVFANIMVDFSYVECTSACIQALAAWRRSEPAADATRIDRAISDGARFLRRIQREDGSWEGSWGVCFSYGTWFGVNGLVAAGAKPGDPALSKAASFLKEHQRPDGSWSELLESCRQRKWVEGESGHAVNTSCALMTLTAAGERETDVVRRGVAWLRGRQGSDGTWPPEPMAGVFNRTCGIHYDAYLKLFPVWALAVCA